MFPYTTMADLLIFSHVFRKCLLHKYIGIDKYIPIYLHIRNYYMYYSKYYVEDKESLKLWPGQLCHLPVQNQQGSPLVYQRGVFS